MFTHPSKSDIITISVTFENISNKDHVRVVELKQKLTDPLKSNIGKWPLVIIEESLRNLVDGNLNKKDCTISKKETTTELTNESKSDVNVTVDKDCKMIELQDDYNTVVEEEEENKPVTGRHYTKRARKRTVQENVNALRENRTKDKQPTEKKSGDDSKKPKLKQKRLKDHYLRSSIEEQKTQETSNSDEERSKAQPAVQKNKGFSKRSWSSCSTQTTKSPTPSSDTPSENSKSEVSTNKEKKPKINPRVLLDLEIYSDTENLLKDGTPITQSKRINESPTLNSDTPSENSQIKITEQAEHRKLEELTLNELKHKRKHWEPTQEWDALIAWESSSDSSSSSEDESEEEENEDDLFTVGSSHEFSPESDFEESGEVQPVRKARTARKDSDAEVEEVGDCACKKCGEKDYPEWILLCDSCDSRWHCSCLRPALLVIPEGDWFCPLCQHATLVKKLEAQLRKYDRNVNKSEIGLGNVLPKHQLRGRPQTPNYTFTYYDELINSAIQEEIDLKEANMTAGDAYSEDDIPLIKREMEKKNHRKLDSLDVSSEDDIPLIKRKMGKKKHRKLDSLEVGSEDDIPLIKRKMGRKKHRKLYSLDVSSEDDIPLIKRKMEKKNHRKLDSLEVSSEDDIPLIKRKMGIKKHRKLVSSGDDAASDGDFEESSTSSSRKN